VSARDGEDQLFFSSSLGFSLSSAFRASSGLALVVRERGAPGTDVRVGIPEYGGKVTVPAATAHRVWPTWVLGVSAGFAQNGPAKKNVQRNSGPRLRDHGRSRRRRRSSAVTPRIRALGPATRSGRVATSSGVLLLRPEPPETGLVGRRARVRTSQSSGATSYGEALRRSSVRERGVRCRKLRVAAAHPVGERSATGDAPARVVAANTSLASAVVGHSSSSGPGRWKLVTLAGRPPTSTGAGCRAGLRRGL